MQCEGLRGDPHKAACFSGLGRCGTTHHYLLVAQRHFARDHNHQVMVSGAHICRNGNDIVNILSSRLHMHRKAPLLPTSHMAH